MLRSKIPAVLLTFATLAAVPTTAFAESGEEQVQATESTTVMADRRPYRPPPRRYVRPAPRRVYVAPAYTPRPRRVIEVPYTPMFHFGIGLNGNSVMSAEGDSSESRPSFVEGLGDGAGFDISFGWRLSDFISLDFNWLMSFHDGGVESRSFSALLGLTAAGGAAETCSAKLVSGADCIDAGSMAGGNHLAILSTSRSGPRSHSSA